MIRTKIGQGSYFDRQSVTSRLDAAERRNLPRFGAFVRQKAISSMLGHFVRKGFGSGSKVSNREGTSKPGEPPYPHTGLIVKHVEFVYEPSIHDVIIGPARLNGTPANCLSSLEHGGTSVLEEKRGPRRITVEARPFMQPALKAELSRVPPMWRDSIRR